MSTYVVDFSLSQRRARRVVVNVPLKELRRLPEWNTPAYRALPKDMIEAIDASNQSNGIFAENKIFNCYIRRILRHGYKPSLLGLDFKPYEKFIERHGYQPPRGLSGLMS